MHSEHLHSEETIEIDLHGLFGEAGMGPDGDFWIVPTQTFLRIWPTSVGDYLRKRGFRLENDGKEMGASEECVVHLPAHLMKEVLG